MKLGFLDRDKINGLPNVDLPLILTVTIDDRNLTEFLIDEGSSCDILYSETVDLIGIPQEDLKELEIWK